MKVLITGADGFIGKNLQLHLAQRNDVEVVCFTRQNDVVDIESFLQDVDFVFHLAGVNRPKKTQEFSTGNVDLTQSLTTAILESGRDIPLVFTSSIQASLDNDYGRSKRKAEDLIFELSHRLGIPAHVFRLPNVFGKWCKPNYNSVVATFCHNIARDLPIEVNDTSSPLKLVYVDDIIERFLLLMDGSGKMLDEDGFEAISPCYQTTLGELAGQIKSFRESRSSLVTERVGTGLVRALHSTYLSYLPADSFTYEVKQHADSRGVFVEMLKTPDCGQFSYFTAHPGITRGGHFHHSKTEKFLVIKGNACFKFRHMQTGETYEIIVNSKQAKIVETIPGWTHDITNIGNDELLVMLWANEVFDSAKPDTFACAL